MAKRMKFSVIGLPHYTIWHLYEPSVDDLRHMEEMEMERQAREQEERERKLAEQREAAQAKADSGAHKASKEYKGSEEGPVAQPAKDATKGASNI
jgi:mannan polymerase II complex ANP1 subunit